MMKLIKVLGAAFLFFLSSAAWSTTFMVDTREVEALEDMDIHRRTEVLSIESEIMDLLFNQGYIFFNTYSVPDENGRISPVEASLNLARDEGVDYLLILIPQKSGASWTLYDVGQTNVLGDGYVDIAQTNEDEGTKARWGQLGRLLAAEMMTKIP